MDDLLRDFLIETNEALDRLDGDTVVIRAEGA